MKVKPYDLFLGRHYKLRVIKIGKKTEPSVKAWRGRFEVRANGDLDEGERAEQVRALLMEWFKEHAKERLQERAEIFAKKLGQPTPKVWVRNQQKRWGSCDKHGNLRFNWHIVMAPMSLVDYVVAHEICHLKYPDHSAAFWKAMRSLMPDYEERRERLRREGRKYLL